MNSKRKVCAGIDAGSRTLKIVLVDSQTLEPLAGGLVTQVIKQSAAADELLSGLMSQAGISADQVVRTIATGYGRNIIECADATITEITCHAAGVSHCLPGVSNIIDIGGQDSKYIRLGAGGCVDDFAMNDRCAAGTGHFLEVVAQRLEVGITELGTLAARSDNPAVISSMCVVFAETEIIGLLAQGVCPEDVAAGVQKSIVQRVAAMAGRSLTGQVAFTGGVALIPGMKQALSAVLSREVVIADQPQLAGALGAALIAAGHVKNRISI